MNPDLHTPAFNLTAWGDGILGAVGNSPEQASANRTLLIEQRILRIEMALRQAGIEVESLPLPEPRR